MTTQGWSRFHETRLAQLRSGRISLGQEERTKFGYKLGNFIQYLFIGSEY